MTKLYIIGNGFDKHHKLPTNYYDFHQFVITNYSDVENLFEEYFQLRINENNLWSDFENDLESFKWNDFYAEKNHINLFNENFKPSLIYDLEDNLKQETDELVHEIKLAFGNWLNQINLKTVNKSIEIEKEAFFLNFNYTFTLEEIYKIPSELIYHIHGDIKNNLDSLIFGHNKELNGIPEFSKNGYSNRTLFTDSENMAKYPFYAFQKPVNEIIYKNKNYFKSIKNVNEIIVLGHSLNSIDIPYFIEIMKYVKNNAIWKVSFYNEEEKKSHQTTLEKIGIEKCNIKLINLN